MLGLRAGFGFASLILIAGSIVLMFFVVLSGVKDTTPLNKTYFLQAHTSTIAGSGRDVSQWTYFYVCGEGNTDCGDPVPALPFGYAWVGGSTGAPGQLVGKHGKRTTSSYYYYMWRFGWVFYLISLVFTVMGFLTALAAPISRLAAGFSGLIIGTALFFFTISSSLMTAVFVKARDRFRDSNMDAHIGSYAFGFTWGAWSALFMAMILLFAGCGLGGRKDTTTGTSGGIFRGFPGRHGSRRSTRGSFIDNEGQRRVKEEY